MRVAILLTCLALNLSACTRDRQQREEEPSPPTADEMPPESVRPPAETANSSSTTTNAGSTTLSDTGNSSSTTTNTGSTTVAGVVPESGGSVDTPEDVARPATLFDPRQPPPGINIALAALGGAVVSATSEAGRDDWWAANLIDGGRAAWASKTNDNQEVVLSFREQRQSTISAVVVDLWTDATNMDNTTQWYLLPGEVQVWVSTTSPTSDFTRVATARLEQLPAPQVIAFSAVRAKYVKVRFVGSHKYMVAGEVQVMEVPNGPSIVDDLPKNVALPAVGGSIVQYTSQKAYRGRFGDIRGEVVGFLLDGGTSSIGWVSANNTLPQDIVLAFQHDESVLIDRIVLNPQTPANAATRVREFSVALSDHPSDGFRDVGTFTLANVPGDQSFPINREGRYLRLRLLSNHGSTQETSLGEIQVIEGIRPGYVSVVRRSVPATMRSRPSVTVDETDVMSEIEPNDALPQANALTDGRRTKGQVNPLGELDFFRLPLDRSGVLTLELLGRPTIRTSLTLQDESGQVLKQWAPAQGTGPRAEFSWNVTAGERVFEINEPPVSAFIAMDTSGSLSAEDLVNLRTAIVAYTDEIRPTERYHLSWFSEKVELMTEAFTNDRAVLKASLAKLPTSGGYGTTLYDAIAKGIELVGSASGNRAIIVLTDGEDVSSGMSYPALWELARRAKIPIYAIGMGPELLNYEAVFGTTPHRLLVHLTRLTGGRFFFARSSAELTSVFREVASELRTPSTYYLRPTLSRGTGGLSVEATGERIASVSAPGQIELILDGSGSMRRRIEGRMMIDVAKEVMSDVIQRLPDDAAVALRVYGHRIREGTRGDCQDSELVVPFQKIDKTRMVEQVRRINALGTTPIAYTLQQVARDFAGAPGEKLVILVTDGKEECKGDPAAVVADLVKSGLKVRLNVVGFALADAATKKDMERVAQLTGGTFFDAANPKALTLAIDQALSVPYDVLDASGARVGGGLTGQSRTDIPEGIYSVKVHAAGVPIEIPNVRITQDGLTRIVLKKEGTLVGVQVVDP